MKIYKIDGKILAEAPKIEIDDKLYPVDNRLSASNRLQAKLKELETAENKTDVTELHVILDCALGEKASKELIALDYSKEFYSKLVSAVLAAMEGTTIEAIEKRRFPDGQQGE